MKNAIKVKCQNCAIIYWREYEQKPSCCQCKGRLMEWMVGAQDYDWKKQLENNQ